MTAVRKCWMCESDFYAVLPIVPFRFFFATLNTILTCFTRMCIAAVNVFHICVEKHKYVD
jgi:hypothetical protein